MLGSRDPSGPSCVAVIKTGDVKDAVPNNPGDWNGGPGTTMAYPYNNVSQAIPGVVMTGITDVTGVLTFSYQPLTSPTGTWRYSVRCTSGNETLVSSPTFTVP